MPDRKLKTDELKKRLIRKRDAIRQAFRNAPDALGALQDQFKHSAADIAAAEGDKTYVMLGHREVIETLETIISLEGEALDG